MDADSASCKYVFLWPVNSSEGALCLSGLLSFMAIMFIATSGPPLLESLKQEPENCRDKFAVAVIKNGRVVGHIPKSVSRAVYLFLNRDGHSGFCEVTARPTNCEVDLGIEVPCVYGRQLHIDRQSQ